MTALATAHVKGSTAAKLLDLTVPALLARTVQRFGARPGLVVRQQKIRWSYAEFAAAVDRLASGLLALGLIKGERIGIWSPNRYEWVVTQFATARAGLVLVNINPAYRLAELEYALNKVGCKALILAPSF